MKRKSLRSMLAAGPPVTAAGAWDPLSSRLVEMAGFPAVYLTGCGITATLLGKPDIGLITLPELVGVVRNVCASVEIPVIADGESGFGNAVNLVRTVREYEQAGVSALHLEDQVVPRRTQGLLPEVVPAQEHAAKIRAAVGARRSRELVVIGRTDCVERLGIEEAIRRGNLYSRAGADVVFVHGIRKREELRAVGERVKGPKLLNYTALTLGAGAFRPSLATLRRWGFSVVIFAIEPLLASIGACAAMLDSMRRGKPGGAPPPWGAWKAVMDGAVRAREHRDMERFLPPEAEKGGAR